MPARHLTIVHYPHPRGSGWYCDEVDRPEWDAVAAAIRNMDDDEHPIVQLSWKAVESGFDDMESFNIIGGAAAGFALFECEAGWQFDDPAGGDEDVRLWRSDQGYFCKRRNIITDVETVLRLARTYFDTGSFEAVEREARHGL